MTIPTSECSIVESLVRGCTKKDGIWVDKDRRSVSYPAEGADVCFSLEDESFWFRHRNECVRALIQRFRLNGSFLDVGGGNGFVSKMIQELGFEVVMMEPGWEACRRARSRGIRNIICTDFNALDDVENGLDVIGLFDVLEHVPDERPFLNKCSRYLKKGGQILLTSPAYPALWSSHDSVAGHFRRYTAESVERVLLAAGFEKIYVTYYFQFLMPLIFIFRRIPFLLGVRLAGVNQDKERSSHLMRNGLMKVFLDSRMDDELSLISKSRLTSGASLIALFRKT